jgi:hypothetical protein
MSAKLERDFVAADLSAVEGLLSSMRNKNSLAAFGLQTRCDELRLTLADMIAEPETRASAALFFSGRPVVANRGIETAFGTAVVDKFQDVVTKMFALHQTGSLGQRGAVPGKDLAKLHITNVVHGSFGFRLEELVSQGTMVDSELKIAVGETSRLMEKFGEADDEPFDAAVENLDDRVLGTIREFFDLLRNNDAAFRLVAGELDRNFDRRAVERAAERARVTTLHEETIDFEGQLYGALRDSRTFDYRTETERGVISGKVAPELSTDEIARINRELSDKDSRATVRVKQVLRGEKVSREMFTLVKIETR